MGKKFKTKQKKKDDDRITVGKKFKTKQKKR
jgi:hypothetical protein